MSQYEQFTISKGSSESWEKFGLEKKVFIKDTLRFELVNDYEKEYSLTECRPSYIPEFALWINQSYYTIDKNWGKYLFINNCSEKVNLKEKNVWYNIYRNIPSQFTENFFRFILNMNIETTTQVL